MLENLIETIKKDALNLKELSDPKQKRKEASLLRQRVLSAEKLLLGDAKALKELQKVKDSLKN